MADVKRMKTTCPHCGGEINPASLLGKGKPKTMTDAAIAARKANGAKGGRPRKTKEQHAAMTAAKLAKKGGA